MSRTHKEEQNDHEWELAAWELLSEAKATADLWIQKAKLSEWETFCDLCYYDLWRVRRKNERGFNDGYHIHNGEEARALVELLNGLERDIAGWETKWKCAVEMAAKAENERDMLRSLLTHNEIDRDELKEQLDAAIMLGKMQERRHERERDAAREQVKELAHENENLYRRLESVHEVYRLSSVCRKLIIENQKLKGEQP